MGNRYFYVVCLIVLLLCLAPIFSLRSKAAMAGQIEHAEIKAFLYADGGYFQPVTAGFYSNFDANGYGAFGWEFNNPSAATLQNARLVVFLDADLDHATTTFFNEHGALVNLNLPPGAMAGDIAASSWEIDEPGFLFGDLAQHLTTGALDQLNHVPANTPDDVSLALGFQLGLLPANSPVKVRCFISATDIGGLSQTDSDTGAKFYFNAFTPNVTCPSIVIDPPAIPEGTVGLPYLLTSFTAHGANGTVTFSVTSGALPSGMSLVGGLLSGTPTQSGSFNFTVTATDAYTCGGSRDYTLVVNCPTIVVSPGTIPIAQINAAYPTQTFSASGGNAPYTFSQTGALPAGMSFNNGQLSGAPAQHGDFPITVTATDKYGCKRTRNYTLKVNRPPVALCQNLTVTSGADCAAAADINNGSSDPDGDPITITQTPAGPYSVGAHAVTLTVDDGRGAVRQCAATVKVNPPVPTVAITGPPSGYVARVNTPVNFTGTFTDLAGTTHTASWQFTSAGASLTKAGAINESSGAISATQSFTTAGVYLVSVSVTNNCTGQAQTGKIGELAAMVVIYDPSAGFVTGGGWIDSPAGAFVENPSLTGKANFDFNSKYHNGATIPTGNTGFHFNAANLNFKSTSYQWLVVAGARAQCKGTGRINNAGDYRFIITVIDGQADGGGGDDKFRIRIWNNAGGGLIYDNQPNAPDYADPTTAVSGGNIVIHKQ
jgi:hypothetical protein